MTGRVAITPTLMSALTGDSRERQQEEVPKSIEVPVESVTESVADDERESQMLSSSSSKQAVNDVLREYAQEQKQRMEETSEMRPSIVDDVLQEHAEAQKELVDKMEHASSAALSEPKVDEISKVSSTRSQGKNTSSVQSKQSNKEKDKPLMASSTATSKRSTASAQKSSAETASSANKSETEYIAWSSKASSTRSEQQSTEDEPSESAGRTRTSNASNSTPEKDNETRQSKRLSKSTLKRSSLSKVTETREPMRQYLPRTLLGDVQTDVLPRTTERVASTKSKEKKMGPFEPEFDDLSQLLLGDLQVDDSPSAAVALQKLGSLLKNKHNVETSYALGAHVTLSVIMRKYPKDPEIQRWGCFCFSSMVRTKYKPTIAIAKSGGIEALVNAMRLLPDSYSIQTNGLLALENLISDLKRQNNRSAEAGKVTLRFVYELDGLQLIVQAMDRFPKETYLQSICCELCMLLVDKCKSRALKNAGVVMAVANAGENHPELAQVAWRFMNAFFGSGKEGYEENKGSTKVQPATKKSGRNSQTSQPEMVESITLKTNWAARSSKYFGGRRTFYGR